MHEQDSTQELAEKAKSGDREAFQALVARFAPRLETLVRARMGVHVKLRAGVEDVVRVEFINKDAEVVPAVK